MKLYNAILVAASAVLGLCAHATQSTPEHQGTVYSYDGRPLNQLPLAEQANAERVWDTMHVLSALQGLVNREAPRLYLFYCSEFGVDTDQFWFDWFRNEDGWLKAAEIQKLQSLEQVVETFRDCFTGLVVYDPKVPATANLASTFAGTDRLLPVRFDAREGSIFRQLKDKLGLPAKVWLVKEDGSSKFTGKGTIPDLGEKASTGSSKVDAYLWALEKFVKNGRCAPGIAAYYIDSFWLRHPRQAGPTMHTLSNHDFFIARKAFFFDLSPWGDETPNDDPDQPLGLDRKAFLEVMRALYDQAGGGILRVGGFTPWPYKYTSHAPKPGGKHDGVPTEWEFGRLISQFNGYMEADAAGLAGMANASFYQHYPLPEVIKQKNPRPSLTQWQDRGYVTPDKQVRPGMYLGHYVGDYDAPSWLYKAVASLYRDPKRGQVPLGWAFDPNLGDRAPQALAYAYWNATTNDFFIAGDSGAGYLNPRALTVRPDSGLPSGLEAWRAHCEAYYKRWNMSITGFILDGSGGSSTDLEFEAYRTFSPDGAGTHFEQGPALKAGLPTHPERDLPDNVEEAARVVAAAARKGEVTFFWARSILKSPAWYARLSELLATKYPEAKVTTVDPYTFFGLIRTHLQSAEAHRN